MENYCRQKDGYKESFSKNMVVPRAKSKGWNSERRNTVLVYIEQEV